MCGHFLQVGPWTRTKRESRLDPRSAADTELSPRATAPPTAFSDVTNLKAGMMTRSASKKRTSQLLVQ